MVPLLPDVETEVPPARHVSSCWPRRSRTARCVFGDAPARRVTYPRPLLSGPASRAASTRRESSCEALPGVTLVEMEEHRENSRCCGGGAGRMWFEPEEAGGDKMSERRVRQAAATGAEVLAAACPWCLIQFEDAVKTAGLEGRLRVADVTELAAEVLQT